jgi:23S rRNA (guanosine2251-2'-O)-methyltransferase
MIPSSRGGNLEILTGRQSVRETLRAQRRHIVEVLLAEGTRESEIVAEIEALCREGDVLLRHVDRRELESLVQTAGGDLVHQGVAARVSAYPYADLTALLARAAQGEEPLFLLALDSVQDPQNLGAILRTAEAVGVHGVILPERRAAAVTPAVSRASAGAVEHLFVAMVTNLVRAMEALKEQGVWVVGVEQHAQAQDYRRVDLNIPLALVMGGEGPGMRRLVRETCDLLVHLPMRGQVGSLNVSVAAGVLLYHAWAARGIE